MWTSNGGMCSGTSLGSSAGRERQGEAQSQCCCVDFTPDSGLYCSCVEEFMLTSEHLEIIKRAGHGVAHL